MYYVFFTIESWKMLSEIPCNKHILVVISNIKSIRSLIFVLFYDREGGTHNLYLQNAATLQRQIIFILKNTKFQEEKVYNVDVR